MEKIELDANNGDTLGEAVIHAIRIIKKISTQKQQPENHTNIIITIFSSDVLKDANQ